MVTNTDTGTPGARESSIPPTAATSAKRIVSPIARTGLDVTAAAAAAGVMRSESTSSAPTTCTACAAASPTSTAKIMLIARTGTPRASATSGSAEENTSGR